MLDGKAVFFFREKKPKKNKKKNPTSTEKLVDMGSGEFPHESAGMCGAGNPTKCVFNGRQYAKRQKAAMGDTASWPGRAKHPSKYTHKKDLCFGGPN